jgi:hypothetical protein
MDVSLVDQDRAGHAKLVDVISVSHSPDCDSTPSGGEPRGARFWDARGYGMVGRAKPARDDGLRAYRRHARDNKRGHDVWVGVMRRTLEAESA